MAQIATLRSIRAILVGTILVSSSALGQVETGVLHGVAVREDGVPLEGAEIELSGIGAPRVAVTDARGRYFLPELDPGEYRLETRFEGLPPVVIPEVEIRLARSTRLDLVLKEGSAALPGPSRQSPTADERLLAPGVKSVRLELERIPTARDPWALLPQTPGIRVDRVDVGGSETGRQPVFAAPAATRADNEYFLDGVPVTDMLHPGRSMTFFDFDEIWQAEVRTGGPDVRKMTPGATINLITRRGTNELRGSARIYVTDGASRDGETSESETNTLDRVSEMGLEAGGAALRDRVWLWGSWARSRIDRTEADERPRDSELDVGGIRVDARPVDGNSLVARRRRQVLTRFATEPLVDLMVDQTLDGMARQEVHVEPRLAPEATFDLESKVDILKLEDTHLFGSKARLSGSWAEVDHDLLGDARHGTGPDAPEPLLVTEDVDLGTWTRNGYSYRSERSSSEARFEGALVLARSRTQHEVELGGRYRRYEAEERFKYPGRQLLYWDHAIWGFDRPDWINLIMHRTRAHPMRLEYSSLWAQDTVNRGPWTLNLGLRWDSQEGRNESEHLAGHPEFPWYLRPVTVPETDAGFVWESLTPRLGFTWAIGSAHRTLIRSSWSRFVSPLTTHEVQRTRPVGWPYENPWTYCGFVDGNGNRSWDGEPIDELSCMWVDPIEPPVIENDPGLDPAKTDELILAGEHAVRPEMVAGFGLTWRRTTGVLEDRRIVRDYRSRDKRPATRDDYSFAETVDGILPDGSRFSVDIYKLDWQSLGTYGFFLTNGDRQREFLGLDLTFDRRFTGRWMLRGHLHWGDTTWHVPESFLAQDDPTDDLDTGDNDGDLYYQLGERPDRKLTSSWSANVNGLVRIAPEKSWSFNVAGNFHARQGFPLPYWTRGSWRSSYKPVRAVGRAAQLRLSDLYVLDLRLDKDFPTGGQGALTLSLDVFNVFDSATVLARELDLGSPRAGMATEVLAGRKLRLGLRFGWR